MEPKIAVVVLLLAGASLCARADDLFLKIDSIPGESTDAAHPGEIRLLSWSWGVSNTVTIGSGGATTGKAIFGPLSVSKRLDKASPKLMLATCNGQHLPQAILVARRPDSGKGFEWLKITLSDVLVTSVTSAPSGDSTGQAESVSFISSKVSMEYTPQNQDGSPGTNVMFGWDIAGSRQL